MDPILNKQKKIPAFFIALVWELLERTVQGWVAEQSIRKLCRRIKYDAPADERREKKT